MSADDNSERMQKPSAEEALRLLFPDLSLLGRIEQLRIASASKVKGTLAGKRRSVSLGGSQEFADYRPYAPGDDVRRIDWSVYGRTRRAYVRQFWDEQELVVHMYVDVSRSMSFGEQDANKLHYALKLAASVGYAALCGDDRVSIKLFNDRVVQELPPVHGRAASPKWFQFIADAMRSSGTYQTSGHPSPELDLSVPFRAPGTLPHRSGVTWLFTDAMFEEGIEETLLSLQAAKQQVVLCHLLSPSELEPALSGELKLIDSELKTGKDIAVGHRLLSDYRMAVTTYREQLERICAERGATYVFVNTGVSLTETIHHVLLPAQALSGKS
ncbi:DUF58 domain-containing protein [Paenibacillus harenae]|uniref:Uncharacterized protein (DUF58 family) n=1 Tax=Paenibacillus harenae TaxID=306543 RepID=A0ABT9UEN6_PAEHA|nr:DUF58 domain-containing protein [Paenibacillus harenae]MDQ0116679.1 uncharacterized protein (DUF58 family) [Paenibacillus harenae]